MAESNSGQTSVGYREEWVPVEWDVGMYRQLQQYLFNTPPAFADLYIRDACVESVVLHARQLCGLFLQTERQPDDIRLVDLFSDWDTNRERYVRARSLIAKLREIYGDSKTPGSMCWEFNKKLFHITNHREAYNDFKMHLRVIHEPLQDLLKEMERLRGLGFFRIWG
jgi:hypothetical protein